ncbi:MAG TPA: sugar ABC transporter ATP-binding protein [Xanthobacteraceae bacterium]|nr:sugar ABC transporter ATP-binding protein [Xanthobacteraceae bacterium]
MTTEALASAENTGAGISLPAPLLQAERVSKQFPGVLALDAVDFELRAGEAHVLFGENGAGKSTLIQMLAGVHRPTEGSIRFRGELMDLQGVHHARTLGISAVFQEFSLVPTLTIEENLFLGAELTNHGLLDKLELHRRADDILKQLGFPLRPRQRVQDLTRAEQQMVEIAKAFRTDLSVLILDEPTASLTDREAQRLFAMVEQAKSRGVGVVYVTHRMSEIRRIGDRITVLRDGKRVVTLNVAEVDDERLLQFMTGRVISQVFPKIEYRPGEPILQISELTTAQRSVKELSIEVRTGEVVGLAGLVGSGKSVVGRACFGLERLASGRIMFDGQDVTGRSAREMLDLGIFYLPPDRREEGLIVMRSIRENVSLPWLGGPPFTRTVFLDRGSERSRVREVAERLNLQPPNIEHDVERLSGGNQQKVLLAKGLVARVKLFILDEPTVGVDVGTRVAIYGFIRDLCENGAGILLISSDLPEILHLTNRTYVMYRGELRAELAGSQITQDRVLANFFERAQA